MKETQVPPTQVSKRFCAPDSDITFQSSDGILFNLHRKNLEVHSDCFPPPEISTRGEVVPLSENSVTLDLLFQFIYPQRHPKLEGLDFTILAALTEAVEKYQIYSAMDICNIWMRNALPDHPLEILQYAAKHDYPEVADLAAPLTLDIPFNEIINGLVPSAAISWMKYYEKWKSVLQIAFLGTFRTSHDCDGGAWETVYPKTLLKLGARMGVLLDSHNVLGWTEPLGDCCKKELARWHAELQEKIREIPKCSTFL